MRGGQAGSYAYSQCSLFFCFFFVYMYVCVHVCADATKLGCTPKGGAQSHTHAVSLTAYHTTRRLLSILYPDTNKRAWNVFNITTVLFFFRVGYCLLHRRLGRILARHEAPHDGEEGRLVSRVLLSAATNSQLDSGDRDRIP